MSAKYSGFAAVLQISISAVFTDIAGVRDISGPELSLNMIDVSSRDAAWLEFVAGMKDAGEITFDVVYDPDTPTHSASVAGGFIKSLVDGSVGAYKVKFSDATPLTGAFSAFVIKVAPKMPFNGAQTADVTLKVNGSITWT